MTTADGKAVTGKDLEMELEKDIPDPEKTNSEEQVTLPDVENTESKPEAEKISYGWRHYITLLSGLLSMFCVSLEMTIVSTAIPRITDEFQSLKDIGWYASAYFMTLAAFQPMWGKLLKYWPVRIVFAAAGLGFNLGCIICAVAENSTTLIAGRAVQGALGAGLIPGIYTIIAHIAPTGRREMYMGLIGALFGVTSAIGPILGGVFTDNVSWRWVFWINLPISAPAIFAFLCFYRQPEATKFPQSTPIKEKLLQLDLPSSAVIMGAVICYLLAMQDGGVVYAWSSARSIGLLVGFCLLSLLFAGVQYLSGDRAVFRRQIFANRTLWVMCVVGFFSTAALQVLMYFLPIYFQAARDVSASRSGTNMLPIVLTVAAFAIACGGLMMAWGQYVPILLLGCTPLTIGAGLIYTFDLHTSTAHWIGYEILVGVGLGTVVQIPIMVAQSIVAIEDVSTISANILWCQTTGSAIWVSAAQAGFANKLLERLSVYAPEVDPRLILAVGASELADEFSGEVLEGVLRAYMEGLRVPFLMTVVIACVATAAAPLARWGSIKGKLVV